MTYLPTVGRTGMRPRGMLHQPVSGAVAESPSGGFAPSDIAGLVAWYDASDTATITASGGAVSQWNDKSGGGRHVSQGSGASQPTTGTRTINGLNVLDFNGKRLLNLSFGVGSTFTVFVVAASDSLNNWQAVVSGNQGGGEWGFGPYAGKFHWYPGTGNYGTYTVDVPFILTATSSGAGAGENDLYVNGGSSIHTYSFTRTLGNLSLGQYYPSPDSFDGRLGEVIIYDSVLGTTDRGAVCDYLNTKWAVY